MPKNELKITGKCRLGAVLKYVWHILEKDKSHRFIIMRGAGSAIANVVALTELIRSCISNLYTLSEITTIGQPIKTKYGEEWERNIVMLKVTLTLDEDQIDPWTIGF